MLLLCLPTVEFYNTPVDLHSVYFIFKTVKFNLIQQNASLTCEMKGVFVELGFFAGRRFDALAHPSGPKPFDPLNGHAVSEARTTSYLRNVH